MEQGYGWRLVSRSTRWSRVRVRVAVSVTVRVDMWVADGELQMVTVKGVWKCIVG